MNETTSVLTQAFAALRPGIPITNGALALLPFTTTYRGGCRYVLLPDAIARGRLTITEVDDGGAVPFLRAVNKGPWPVLIFDGEELVGAKQNRIVNTTMLLGVGESIVPVSCVEQGRWSMRSRAFSSGSYASHPSLRKLNQARVGRSLKEAEGGHWAAGSGQSVPQPERAGRFRSDQGAVWNEVGTRSLHAGVSSQTGAMADAYEERAADLSQLQAAFAPAAGDPEPGGVRSGETRIEVPVEGMVAVAVFLGSRFLCFDALWPAKRFAQVWPKLLRGYAFEALDVGSSSTPPADPEAEMLRLFAGLAAARPDVRAGVDLGRDVRVESKAALGAGLLWDDSLVQLSVFPR